MLRSFVDSFKHKGLRNKLVETIHKKGITDKAVLQAINSIPRHWFLDSAMADHAYQDKALPIGEGQTISQPFTVAYQTQFLQVAAGMKVLEIGTGSGYQGAVICALGAQLFSVERIASLSKSAQIMFKKLGYMPNLLVGDGSLGWPQMAPFDRIIVTAAAPEISHQLYAQLKPGGIMIIPVGEKVQVMYRVMKTADGEPKTEKLEQFRFVPLIGEAGFKP
ncbi:protein-L-isoaspartate(D-aspartate) O-methyltransferase [bacterium]|nr:protein-L-isoaspartate(D-aspartate) O-methyltransferase [bacterium]